MALLKRIDSFDITYADSFARKELKVREYRVHKDGRTAEKGIGEKRMYIGHDEKALDDFFTFDKLKGFFIQRDDLEEYLRSITAEYLNPRYEYGDSQDSTMAILNYYCPLNHASVSPTS